MFYFFNSNSVEINFPKVHFKFTTIFKFSQVIDESKIISKTPSPFNIFFMFLTTYSHNSKETKNGAGHRDSSNLLKVKKRLIGT